MGTVIVASMMLSLPFFALVYSRSVMGKMEKNSLGKLGRRGVLIC